MKKIILITIVFLCLSCGDDKDNNTNITDPYGRAELIWTKTQVAVESGALIVSGYIRNDTDYEATGLEMYFEFRDFYIVPHDSISTTTIPPRCGNFEIWARTAVPGGYSYTELTDNFIVWE